MLPLVVLIRMGPQNERGSWTCTEPLEERVESLIGSRISPFNDFVSCYTKIYYYHHELRKDKKAKLPILF